MAAKEERRVVISIRAFRSLIQRTRNAARRKNIKHVDWIDAALRAALERKPQ